MKQINYIDKMTLHFQKSNYLENIEIESQHLFEYSPDVQIIKINNSNKITLHMWGGGGGGGYGYGGGGGSAFTILDFPYYPFKNDIRLEIKIGKGGTGGYKVSSTKYSAQKGGDTMVRIYEGETDRILKEFVCYGGEPGEDYFDISNNYSFNYQFKKGGNGGMNTNKTKALMNAYYVNNSLSKPLGGNSDDSNGNDTRIYYLSVSGAGGGANLANYNDRTNVTNVTNSGGSFILYPGGSGFINKEEEQHVEYFSGIGVSYTRDYNIGGGGASSYFGKGGNGGTFVNNANGFNAESNSGAGGGGGSIISRLPIPPTMGNINGLDNYLKGLNQQSRNNYLAQNTTVLIGRGGNGGNGAVIIEINGGNYEMR